jgi:serine/threonine-protein kinase
VEQIGRYQILEEIGRGAMGVVYRAQDPAIGRIIAIKTIRLTDLTDPDERKRLLERLFREAQSAGILSHPNIVTIYDFSEEGGKAYVFMEFVNGPPLERLMSAQTPPDKDTLLSILRQTAAALDYAHRKGIVHRDIKPANIMIHDDGQAKITDFGVAKIISHQMTLSGGMMGTPNYMSPEQVQGQNVDGAADQFALAVITYELLTGEKPFTGDYLPTLLYKIVREDPIAPQRLNPSLSPMIADVLSRGLAKNPRDRYATCTEFINEMTSACNATPGWTPLARGSSQSMPTLAGAGPSEPAPLKTQPKAAVLPVPPPRSLSGEHASESNPLLRSLIWVLVGIGMVGLVLLGAQKFLFNPPSAIEQASSPAPPAPPPAPADNAPSQPVEKPSPTGGPAGREPAKELPGEHDSAPEKAEPASDGSAQTAPVPAANQPKSQPEKPGPERPVQLLSEPVGATIVVDNNPAVSCKAPCILSLPSGRHVLTAQLEGYRPYPRVFNVPQDTDVFLQMAKAKGTLNITSTPQGATIQINGDTKPQRTPASFALAPGNYRVRVSSGGVPFDFDVQIKDGEFLTRNVSFQ